MSGRHALRATDALLVLLLRLFKVFFEICVQKLFLKIVHHLFGVIFLFGSFIKIVVDHLFELVWSCTYLQTIPLIVALNSLIRDHHFLSVVEPLWLGLSRTASWCLGRSLESVAILEPLLLSGHSVGSTLLLEPAFSLKNVLLYRASWARSSWSGLPLSTTLVYCDSGGWSWPWRALGVQ